MGQHGAGDQTEPADDKDQHHDRIEKARRLKVNVQVGNHAGKYEERAADCQQPPPMLRPFQNSQRFQSASGSG